jgi:hypothetical protein
MAASDCGQSRSQERTYLPVSKSLSIYTRRSFDCPDSIHLLPPPPLGGPCPFSPRPHVPASSPSSSTHQVSHSHLFQNSPSATNNPCRSHSRHPLCLITPKSFQVQRTLDFTADSPLLTTSSSVTGQPRSHSAGPAYSLASLGCARERERDSSHSVVIVRRRRHSLARTIDTQISKDIVGSDEFQLLDIRERARWTVPSSETIGPQR